MSLTYSTLKTELQTLSHRPDIADAQLSTFVRQAEGEVARRLRAAEMLTRTTFEEANRSSGAIYNLPSNWLEEGLIWNADGVAMEKVSLAEIRKYSAAIDPQFFCVLSKSEIEFRGTPGTNASFEYVYFARPAAFSDASDTNDILTNHEDIYINIGLSKLYTFTQDIELAEGHAGAALDAIETLNEQAGRLLAGARTDGHYCFGPFTRGY